VKIVSFGGHFARRASDLALARFATPDEVTPRREPGIEAGPLCQTCQNLRKEG
jgi:hypothetical protein